VSDLDLAVIGNCNIGALLDERARIVWCCMPRFDGDPVFCSLLNGHSNEEHGFYDVELLNFDRAEQVYEHNTAIVKTTLHDTAGAAVEITDFAPRFKQFGRTFRPTMLVRHIRPRAGQPRIRLRLRPTYGYGGLRPERTRGSNHMRYVIPEVTLRLTTDAPIAYVAEEIPFILQKPLTLVLGPDETLHEPPEAAGRDYYDLTLDYWREWCRYLALPFEWQDEVIRAAITLKLCNYEETGGIIAAMTTSIPEAPHSGRNWDYRYCWLRDAYFVVQALNRLGVTRTMEGYLSYILNIVTGLANEELQPVFGLALESTLDERKIDTLSGYQGMGPVRIGNHAYKQVQNDGYGSVILACAQSFFDRRLARMGDVTLFKRLEHLGEAAVKRWDQHDAGLWELRSRQSVHTYSSVMCWVACDRLAKIALQLGLTERAPYWAAHAKHIREEIVARAWNPEVGSFAGSLGGQDVDASLLLLWEFGFLPRDDPRLEGTLKVIEERLRHGPYLFRYNQPDDIGRPETSFNICTFWYIDVLSMVGRKDEARELFENMLTCRNRLGLLSEDLDVETKRLWGNYPQTYSMVGLINSALRLSKPWEEAF
jgi:Glycosyl hydrolases family 15/Trehalase-like, N-terminal